MSTKSPAGSHRSSGSFSRSSSVVQTMQRMSIDSDRSASSPARQENGATNGDVQALDHEGQENGDADLDPVTRLQKELERTRAEKDALATQYRNLLSKLTAMRTTLGNKLQQDAEELDRREQLVQQLTAQNEDLAATIETLKEELIASHEETERVSKKMDALRSRALQESTQESLLRERELREAQTELERCKIERDEWERAALQEKTLTDDLKMTVETYKRDLELEREAREREMAELESEREKSSNLQSVLQDFQAARDHELRQAVKDYESQLNQATQSLAEFKHRALTAELQLEESRTNTSRAQDLEKKVKEKTLLVNKLRHEAVILNEHLVEALRRLKRSSSETNVDRRLVTNVVLSFLATPRADPKRFEMLSLLANILSWNDQEREKAGLQRAHSNVPPSSSFWSRSSSNSPAKSLELDKTDETESFSRLWVEFLLTEAASGELPSIANSPSSKNNTSLPSTPMSLSPGAPKGTRHLASLTSTNAMASSPNLILKTPPSRKGKERDLGP